MNRTWRRWRDFRVTRGKTPRFQLNIFFSQKLSEIFKFCKVHVFAKLLGHILTFFKILFHIWEFSYLTICSSKKIGRLAPCQGQDATPCEAKRLPVASYPFLLFLSVRLKKYKYIFVIFFITKKIYT